MMQELMAARKRLISQEKILSESEAAYKFAMDNKLTATATACLARVKRQRVAVKLQADIVAELDKATGALDLGTGGRKAR